MKEVYYQGLEEPFILTDEEFLEAYQVWNKKGNYWCNRLNVLLGPFIRFAKPTKDSNDGKVLILPGDKYERKYLKEEDGKIFEITNGYKLDACLSELEEKELVFLEDFLNNKKLLKA